MSLDVYLPKEDVPNSPVDDNAGHVQRTVFTYTWKELNGENGGLLPSNKITPWRKYCLERHWRDKQSQVVLRQFSIQTEVSCKEIRAI